MRLPGLFLTDLDGYCQALSLTYASRGVYIDIVRDILYKIRHNIYIVCYKYKYEKGII